MKERLDKDYVASMEEYINQRELSIEHSRSIIESCEKQIEIQRQLMESCVKQISFDQWSIDRQRKILSEYIDNSK